MPVLPKPPTPRVVISKESTNSYSIGELSVATNWNRRCPFSTVYSFSLILSHTAIISPLYPPSISPIEFAIRKGVLEILDLGNR